MTDCFSKRGIRNNNPGNIRIGQSWHGEAEYGLMTSAQKGEEEFEVFAHATYGIRAIAKLLKNYQTRYGLKTVAEIIGRWAPATENATASYARHVAFAVGAESIGSEIDVTSRPMMESLITAIIIHENGCCPYSYEIQDGMTLAGIN